MSRADIARRGRIVGVDLGSRRIGVAISDGDQRLATPVRALQRSGDPAGDRRAIREVVDEYEAAGVVVGLPRSLSGAIGPAARAALDEVAALRDVVAVPVDTVDERLTTVTAAAGLRASGRSARSSRSLVDAAAATVLLQSWLDRRAAGMGDRGA